MKQLIWGLIAIFSISIVHAKTILISDIDDTIKNSHVLNKVDAAINPGYIENLVLGMNVVYGAVKKNEPKSEIFYVTNALKSIMEASHEEFLKLNKFPAGSIRLRESLMQDNFKITELRKILAKEQPDTAILIGDNGEKDILVYEQVKEEHPQIRFLTYVHLAYSHTSREETGGVITSDQIGFVTSLDLMLQLRKEGVVSNAETLSFVDFFTKAFAEDSGMVDTGPTVIPFWSDCSDFIWTAPDEDLVTSANYLAAKKRIFKRCDISRGED
ncbi:MAG TPA: phosphatase domain-containing protein [Pseudobdellovibrionaceae bacterium]|jgi:hypothetical protein